MPVVYRIDVANEIIRTDCNAPLTFEEVVEHFRTLARDPDCQGHLDVLLNVSQADLPPQSSQFGAINAELGRLREKVQFEACAIAASGDVMFGMMRVFEAHAVPYFRVVRVFRKADDAEAWLTMQRAARNSGK